MLQKIIRKSTLNGRIQIPPSKSHTLRAILFGALGKGKTRITNFLVSPDTEAMIRACQHLGARITQKENVLEIEGVEGHINGSEDVINAGNSGQVLRFVGAVASLSKKPIVLTGDFSIRHNRPVYPLLEGLNQWRAIAYSLREDGYAPILIKGPIISGEAVVDGMDSQPISGLLIAAALAEGPFSLVVRNAGEKPWVGLTLAWFDRLGIPYKHNHFEQYKIEGSSSINGFDFEVPADFSSCAFPLVAGLLTQSEITLGGLDIEDVQGDKKLFHALAEMGAHIEVHPLKREVSIKSASLKGIRVNVNDFIDAIPILAVAACYAEGETHIEGAAIAREKECDRLACITTELRKMGANLKETPDGLVIRPSKLRGAVVNAHHDHRLAMALTVAGMAAEGQTVVQGVECVQKSYGEFFEHLLTLGADIQ